VPEEQTGKPPQHVRDCVVIAVRRGAALIWPWQPAAQTLLAGDRLVVVRATQHTRG
jgi:hypothetical protein